MSPEGSEQVRRAADGDVSPDLSPEGIEDYVVSDATEAATDVLFNVVRDVLAGSADEDRVAVAQWLNAMINGTSPDELTQPAPGHPRAGRAGLRDAPDELGRRAGRCLAERRLPVQEPHVAQELRAQKYHLQVELLKLQAWVKDTGQRIVILFEGRDAAGKGGTIKRFMEHLNPRGARVVALEKPTPVEQGQWYFQRYVQHLPTRGEIVLFDRSWYNRAGVERVMGFCTDEELAEFLRQAPEFERNLTRSGVHLIKFWFSVSQDEQRRRFTRAGAAPAQAVEALADRPRVAREVGRLHGGQERDVPGHRHRRGAVDGDQVRPQEAGPAERDALRAAQDALRRQGRRRDRPARSAASWDGRATSTRSESWGAGSTEPCSGQTGLQRGLGDQAAQLELC